MPGSLIRTDVISVSIIIISEAIRNFKFFVKKILEPSNRIVHSVELLHDPLVHLNDLIDVVDA